ncbi:MAG: motif protein [Gammaproteobacteria bacterium]|jgi:SEC-C motif-containing protein|nr:motif protein [Gammaproteobacteria bacterium]
MVQETCLCGSNIPSEACCNSIINGVAIAATPEQLMRSRYTAFCLRNVDYLTDSHHSSKRQSDDKLILSRHINDTQWLGLRVIQSGIDSSNPNKGFVEFIAYYTEAANTISNTQSSDVKQLHEYSLFVRENGQWFYLSGDRMPPIKFQRNDFCWCNSGKKIKKCHGC